MYIFFYIFIYAFTYLYIYLYIYMYIFIYLYIYIYIYIFVYLFICLFRLTAIRAAVNASSLTPPPLQLPVLLLPLPFLPFPLLRLLHAFQFYRASGSPSAAAAAAGGGGGAAAAAGDEEAPLIPGSAPLQVYIHPNECRGAEKRNLCFPLPLKNIIPQLLRDFEDIKSGAR